MEFFIRNSKISICWHLWISSFVQFIHQEVDNPQTFWWIFFNSVFFYLRNFPVVLPFAQCFVKPSSSQQFFIFHLFWSIFSHSVISFIYFFASHARCGKWKIWAIFENDELEFVDEREKRKWVGCWQREVLFFKNAFLQSTADIINQMVSLFINSFISMGAITFRHTSYLMHVCNSSGSFKILKKTHFSER